MCSSDLINSLKKVPENKIPDIIVNIPEQKGTSGKVVVKDSIVYEKIFIKGEDVIVDSEYKSLYEKAIKENDELAKRNIFLEAIKINEKNLVLVDNDTIKASLWTKNRGELLEYKFDWNIKESSISYEPKVVSKFPKLSLVTGVGVGVPTEPSSNYSFKGEIGIQTGNGDIFTVGPDTEGRFWGNYKKTFKLFN